MFDKVVMLLVLLFFGVEIVQIGFVDCYYLWVVGQVYQFIGVWFVGFFVEWMNVYGGVYVGMVFGQFMDLWKGFQIDIDVQYMVDVIGVGGGYYGVEIIVVGIQIKMVQVVVGIYQIGMINSGVGY